MVLKAYNDFTKHDHDNLHEIRRKLDKKHLRDVTICYNSKVEENNVVYQGVLLPFITQPSELELAVLCGYTGAYHGGGSVEFDKIGGFKAVFKID